jgi:glucose uptake protein GlcU
MARFAPTRSVATVAFALITTTLLALIVSLPFTTIRPATVGYTAMIVVGVGMLLRRRVFPAYRQD